MTRFPLLALAALAASDPALADEGMWTFTRFPREAVERKYGFRAGQDWLDHVRLASARLARGCSASFVSPEGLVMTNQHCVRSCLEEISTAERDTAGQGYLARARGEEIRCPTMEVNQLLAVSDVSAEVREATNGLEGAAFAAAQRSATARIERACQTSDALRCEVVSLWHGGAFELHRYRRFQDVRLVFAPEAAIAHFGGDLDNFEFPRWCLDAAFVRVYQGGRPAQQDHWFRWSSRGAREGELVFVSGNPGATERLSTVAELEYQRDVAVPEKVLRLAELRGALEEFARRGPEARRTSRHQLLTVQNAYKVQQGRLRALMDPAFFAALRDREAAFRSRAARDPQALAAFDGIARAVAERRRIHLVLEYLEGPGSRMLPLAFSGELFKLARQIVRAAEEREKPNEARLREFRQAALPAVAQAVLAPIPIYPEVEILLLGFSLDQFRRALGPDQPLVRKVLGKDLPGEVAARLVRGSRLADPALRRPLWEGGRKAVEASHDPMIELARRIDGEARAVRREFEDHVEAAMKKGSQALALARLALEGTATYPDATFSARLSFGTVRGWEEQGRAVKPFTTLAGAFERATGRDPFVLPESWLGAKQRLALSTPFDLAADGDIIGGNSGSPLLSREAEIVGLVFDGNAWALPGDYAFDEKVNRTVAVDSRAIVEALAKVYRADALVRELSGTPAAAAGAQPRSPPAAR